MKKAALILLTLMMSAVFGAKRTIDFCKANGIEENRIFILEKGLDKWPSQTVAK